MQQQNKLELRKEEDTLPLWKRLDEKRTKGEWNAENNDEGKNSVIYTTNIVEGLCNFYSSDRATYNAQYTALAVNNFASIVEALEKSIQREKKYRAILTGDKTYFQPPYSEKNVHIVELDNGLQETKEALSKIS